MDTLRKEKYYSYNDYLSWNDDVRCELIDGEIYMMSSPSQTHQEISGELFYQLFGFLKGKSCKGTPDLIIEIISPSTAGYDKVLKFNKYMKTGVREYWIVEPESKTLSCHVLKDGHFIASAYGENDIVPVHVLEGCEINLQDVFG